MKCSTCGLNGPFGFALVLLASVIGIRAIAGGGTADMPELFDPTVTYEDATQRAAESGKPVLVFATADWCGPCQTFKKGALKDASVVDFATSRTEPVYLDVDAHPELARQFGVQGIPAMMMVRDGQIVDRFVGVRSAAATVAWLDQAVAK